MTAPEAWGGQFLYSTASSGPMSNPMDGSTDGSSTLSAGDTGEITTTALESWNTQFRVDGSSNPGRKSDLSVLTLPNGMILTLWTSMEANGPSRVWGQLLNMDGTQRGSPFSVTGQSSNASEWGVSAAIGADGNLAFAWTESLSGTRVKMKVVSLTDLINGTLSPVTGVVMIDSRFGQTGTAQITNKPGGGYVVTYQNSEPPPTTGTYINRPYVAYVSGDLQSITRTPLTEGATVSYNPDVATNPVADQILAAYSTVTREGDATTVRIFTQAGGSSGLGPTTMIGTFSYQGTSVWDPQVSVTYRTDGKAVVVWIENTPTGTRVHATVRDASSFVDHVIADSQDRSVRFYDPSVMSLGSDGMAISFTTRPFSGGTGTGTVVHLNNAFDPISQVSTGSRQEDGVLMRLLDGRIIRVWEGYSATDGYHVEGQIYDARTSSVQWFAPDGQGYQYAGTKFGDLLRGGSGHDFLDGGADADELYGGGGNDTLRGGSSYDHLDGGEGADSLDGGLGVDTVSYEASGAGIIVDLMTGTGSGGDADGDTLTSIEKIVGTRYDDRIIGNDADNTLTGRALNDHLRGGRGSDRLDGGADNDILDGGEGADVLIGESGRDTADYTWSPSAVRIDLLHQTASGGDAQGDALSSIENLVGSSFNDTLIGGDGENHLYGGHGNDRLEGGAEDSLWGGTGNDTLVNGHVIFEGSLGRNIDLAAGKATNAEETDTLVNVVYVTGGDGNDTITGASGTNNLFGVNDTLLGGAGFDHFVASYGNDSIDGGADGGEITYFFVSASGVKLDLQHGRATKFNAQQDTLSNIWHAWGSRAGDIIIGDDEQRGNILFGIDGEDTIDGGKGDDILYGGSENDVLIGGEGVDRLFGEEGNDSLTGDADDVLHGGAGDDTLDGGHVVFEGPGRTINLRTRIATVTNAQGAVIETDVLRNVRWITGGDERDTIVGSDGNDSVEAGGGFDLFIGSTGNDTLDGGSGYAAADYGGLGAGIIFDLRLGQVFKSENQKDLVYRIADAYGTGFGDKFYGDDLAGGNVFDGRAGNDTIHGFDGNDKLFGGDDSDQLYGEAHDDTLDGGAGSDLMVGGTGDDVYYIDDLNDVVVETVGEGNDKVIIRVRGYDLSRLQNIETIQNTLNQSPVITDVSPSGNGATGTDTDMGKIVIGENAGTGNVVEVADVDASDEDDDPLTYALLHTYGDLFSIDENGTIRMDKSKLPPITVDKDYALTVSVSDGQGGVALQDVSIRVKNVNQQPSTPGFDEIDSSTVTVNENLNGTFKLLATDDDPPLSGLNFLFDPSKPGGGDADGRFEIVKIGTQSYLKLTGPLDFETAPKNAQGEAFHTVYVKVSDGSREGDTRALTVKIADVDEAPRDLDFQDPQTIVVGQIGVNVVRAQWLDDPDTNPQFQQNVYGFLLANGSVATVDRGFTIDKNTGQISTNDDLGLEGLGPRVLSVVTYAVIGNVERPDIGYREDYTVDIKNSVISVSSPTISHDEGDSAFVEYTFTATRTFAGVAATVSWSIEGTGIDEDDFDSLEGFFEFAANETSTTFTVYVRGDRLAEANETFTVWLEGPTHGTISTTNGSATGVILNDDHAPTLTVTEGQESKIGVVGNTVIEALRALQIEDLDDDPLTVTITFDDRYGGLQYDATGTGVTVAQIIGNPRVYKLRGSAADIDAFIDTIGFEVNGIGQTEFSFTVSDGVNTRSFPNIISVIGYDASNPPPPLPSGTYTVHESKTDNFVVVPLPLKDSDVVIDYKFENHHADSDKISADGRYIIVGNEVRIREAGWVPLQGDYTNSYRIIASDGPNMVTGNVTITVKNNVGPAISAITAIAVTGSVHSGENGTILVSDTAGAVEIGIVQASDPDAASDGRPLSYSLADTYDGLFGIDAAGHIRIADASRLPVDADTPYQLTVRVSDGSNEDVATRDVTVIVTNGPLSIPNHAPTDIVFTGSAAEYAAPETLIGTLSAVDDGVGGAGLEYTLLDNAGGRIKLVNGNQIVVDNGFLLDAEQSLSHRFRVQVTDAGGATYVKELTFGVLDVNPEVTSGTTGNDVFHGGALNDALSGNAGHDRLFGGAGKDTLKGEAGNDTLGGGLGLDKLYGGKGSASRDAFVFDTRLTSKSVANKNKDVIYDFGPKYDSIFLDDAAFTNKTIAKYLKGKGAALDSPYKMKSGFFRVGDKALDKDDFFIAKKVNSKTYKLYWDADGSGAKAMLEIGTVKLQKGEGAALTHKDFFFV